MSTNDKLKDIIKQYKEPEARTYDPKKQIEGYEKRMAGSGIDVDKATDNRSGLERFLGLPDKQNVIFDLFDLLNRPQQALFGAIKANQEGEDAWKAAGESFTGRADKVRFKEILHNAGMDETKGKFGVDDVAGLIGDIVLDPVNLPLFGASSTAIASKASKVSKAEDAVLAARQAANIAFNGSTSARFVGGAFGAGTRFDDALRELAKAEQVFKKTKDLKLYRQSVAQLAFRGIGTGFKKSFQLSDAGIKATLGFIDKTVGANYAAAGLDGLKKLDTLQHYGNIKTMFAETFNVAAGLPAGLFAKAKQVRGKQAFAKNEMMVFMKNYKQMSTDAIANFSKKYGYTLEEIDSYLMTIYENGAKTFGLDGKLTLAGMNKKTSLGALINDEGYLINSGLNKETAEKVENFIKEYMPKWYEQNVSDTQPLWHVATSESGKVIDTYRIGNKTTFDSLKSHYTKLDETDEILKLRTTMPPDVTKAVSDLNNELQELSIKLKSGTTHTLRNGTPIAKIVGEKQARITELVDVEIPKLNATLQRTIGRTGETDTTKRLVAKLKEYGKEVDELNKATTKLYERNKESITDMMEEIKNKIGEFKTQYPDLQPMNGKQLKELAVSEQMQLTMPSYLSDEQLRKIEEFGQLEEVPELLGHIHQVMANSIAAIKKTMNLSDNFGKESGYLSHVLQPDWKELGVDKLLKVNDKNWATTKGLIGNTQSFASRRYKMSAFEANEVSKGYLKYLVDTKQVSDDFAEKLLSPELGKMFSEDINTSVIDFISKSTKAAGDAKMLDVVLGSGFLNPSQGFIKVVESGTKRDPRGFTVITSESLKEKVKSMFNYLDLEDTQFDLIKKQLDDLSGKQLYINNNVNDLIGKITDPKEASSMLEFMDAMTNMFKKNKLLSPGFQLRNVLGNGTNMWLSGMSFPDILKYSRKSAYTLKHGQAIFEKATNGIALTAKEQSIYDDFAEFVKLGFEDMGSKVQDLHPELWDAKAQLNHWEVFKKARAKNPNMKPTVLDVASFPKNQYDKLVAMNMKMNQAQDSVYRLAMLKYAKEHPEFLVKGDYLDAADAVRKTLFDFSDLSVNERDVLRKIIPFYTFTKKNLSFQVSNLARNANRYNNLVKTANDLWAGLDLDEDELDRFKIENFWIPIPFKDKNGKYKAIKSSLPLGDLGEFLSNPLKRGLAATSPIVRAPFELATNKQIFSDMAIEEFKGQRGFYIPEVSKKVEFGLSQLGLDVPAAAAFDVGRAVTDVAKGNINNIGDFTTSSVGRTIVSQGDPAKTASREAYNDLDDLQNLMRYYKQEKIDIKTLAELENRKKFSGQGEIIKRLQSIRNLIEQKTTQ